MKKARKWVQIFFFVLIGLIAVNKTLSETGTGLAFLSEASLHALCPFGGVVTLYNLATLGTFIQKIHASAVILTAIIFILSLLFGPVFCGWVCPLGTIQEWFGKLGKKLFRKRYNTFIPRTVDRFLRYLRIAVLIWVVYVTARSGYLLFETIDPYNALFSFWSDEVQLPALIILMVTLGLSFFVERPWCKYACPYGALLGLTNKFRLFKIRRNAPTCIGCNQCTKKCPMNIPVADQVAVNDFQCISCYECTSEASCPVPDTVVMATAIRKNSISTLLGIKSNKMAMAIIGVIFAGIGLTISMDVWATTSSKVPIKYTSGAYEGEYNPIDIRGSYTLSQVSELFEIDLTTLFKAFSVPLELQTDTFKSKDLEGLYENSGYEIGNETLQVFVALYKNLPIELDDSTIPISAAELILDHNPDLTQEQIAFLEAHQVDVSPGTPKLEVSNEVAVTESTDSEATESEGTESEGTDSEGTSEPIVNGTSTFQKLLDAGLTQEQIESVLQEDMTPTNQTVKDFCNSKGIPFSSVKDQLNALLP